MTEASGPRVRKRLLDDDIVTGTTRGEIDLVSSASIAYSSEDPSYPVENILDSRRGPSGSRWVSARRDVTEHIVIEFDHPQSISRLVYEVEEAECERTQEVRIEASVDAGQTYRQMLVQDYTFSPRGATFEREDIQLALDRVNRLRLIVVPNKNGSGRATLTSLQVFA
jgi:F5/8 type C domain